MEIKFKVNRTVRKSNKLINYRDTMGLTAIQQKLFLFCVTELKKESDFGELLSFDMRDFFRKERLTTREYETIRKAATQLVRTSVSIKNEDGQWAELALFSKIQGAQGSSVIQFKFNEDLKPYLVNLKGNFTSYLYDNVSMFKSGYSVRIYELLVRQLGWQDKYEVTLQYLKEILGVTDVKTYKTFSKFKEKILDKAQEEINAHSDLQITYELFKRGRNVHSIFFNLSSKVNVADKIAENEESNKIEKASEVVVNTLPEVSIINKSKTDVENEKNERTARLFSRLRSYGLSEEQTLKVIKTTNATQESGIWKLLYDINITDKTKINNLKSYLISVLQNTYKIDLS